MCKISENGAKLPTLRRFPRAMHAGLRDGLRARLRTGRWYDIGAWPVVFQDINAKT